MLHTCYLLFSRCHLSFVMRLARYLLFAIVMRFAGHALRRRDPAALHQENFIRTEEQACSAFPLRLGVFA
jgi:hypothetical protein